MLYEGNIAKGVLTTKRFSELLTEGKIEFPTVTVEEIEDRSKADGFSSPSVFQEEFSISTSLLSSC